MPVLIRPLLLADLSAVLSLQAEAYAGAAFELEDRVFFANRLQLAPACCFAAQGPGGTLAGYLVAYPWQGDAVPSLGEPLPVLPTQPDRWYLHDCVVARSARGQGVAAALHVAGLRAAWAQGLRQVGLVAVADAVAYWQRQGYRARQLPGKGLAGYGEGAAYMGRSLAADHA
jgi:ribosomal protein S18 acetylase RimI-like enzyme